MGSNFSDHIWDHPRRYRSGDFLNIAVIVAVVVVYAVNTFFGKPNFSDYFLHCHLNDLFAMPFILAYTNLLISWIGKNFKGVTSPTRIGCLTIFCVVVWEGIAPMLLANSTRDPWDVVAYSIGSICYFAVVVVTDRGRV